MTAITSEALAELRERYAAVDVLPFGIEWRNSLSGLQSALFYKFPALITLIDQQAARLAEAAWNAGCETAPYACHVLAARFDADAGEWVMAVVASPPAKPFTHWRKLDTPIVGAGDVG